MDDLCLVEAAILVGIGYFVLKAIRDHNNNKIIGKLITDNVIREMENMHFSPKRLEDCIYSIENSVLVYRREDGNDPFDFIREELRIGNFGYMFLLGKGGAGTVYYANQIESAFILGEYEIEEWMKRILPPDYIDAAHLAENLIAEVQPPPRGERCRAAMLKQDLKALLIPKLPLSEKNIEVFKCANRMLQASENGYIERRFIVYTEQMEELTGNIGKWRAYGDLARPYIGLYRDEWPSEKKSSEFRKAFL